MQIAQIVPGTSAAQTAPASDGEETPKPYKERTLWTVPSRMAPV
ncbi:MAG: hypothetical protein ACLRWP_08610 [Bilophila wadsworthia]